VSIKSSQGEFIKSFNLSPFLPTKASHSHFESKPLQVGQLIEFKKVINFKETNFIEQANLFADCV
jgi:hypothetical protein